MTPLRLIIDPPASGPWNMAVDEVLLETAAADGVTTLRFYAWSEATLSLGYFQAAADREQHAASSSCPLVRRASGGGAIVHDRELTYSLAMPSRGRFGEQAAVMYNAFHETLSEALASFGVCATLCEGSSIQQPEPFLCFQRHTRGDVLLGNDKIAGSAQRRNRGALLQHGSVLLGNSASAPELPGINDLARISLTSPELIETWLPLLAERLDCQWERQELTFGEQQRAGEIERDRFANPQWTTRR